MNTDGELAVESLMRWRQTILLVGSFLIIGGGLVACSSNKGVTAESNSEAQRGIAEACLGMLHSSLTNEMEIRMDDPRVPVVIRSLKPTHIEIEGRDVVIMRSGNPSEYHLSRSGEANTWVLYVAGGGYEGHKEVLRVE